MHPQLNDPYGYLVVLSAGTATFHVWFVFMIHCYITSACKNAVQPISSHDPIVLLYRLIHPHLNDHWLSSCPCVSVSEAVCRRPYNFPTPDEGVLIFQQQLLNTALSDDQRQYQFCLRCKSFWKCVHMFAHVTIIVRLWEYYAGCICPSFKSFLEPSVKCVSTDRYSQSYLEPSV